jgi:hypothetical protein
MSVVHEAIPFEGTLKPPVVPVRKELVRASGECVWLEALCNAFRSQGGLADEDEMLVMLSAQTSQPISRLARWIVDRSVVCFQSCGRAHVPLFQFDLDTLTLRPAVGAVMSELVDVFDDRELAEWFVTPSCWLDGATPVECLTSSETRVLAAARTDRFVVRG